MQVRTLEGNGGVVLTAAFSAGAVIVRFTAGTVLDQAAVVADSKLLAKISLREMARARALPSALRSRKTNQI